MSRQRLFCAKNPDYEGSYFGATGSGCRQVAPGAVVLLRSRYPARQLVRGCLAIQETAQSQIRVAHLRYHDTQVRGLRFMSTSACLVHKTLEFLLTIECERAHFRFIADRAFFV